MKKIDTITINGLEWAVLTGTSDEIAASATSGDTTYYMFGLTEYIKQKIYLNEDMNEQITVRTIVHELIHTFIYCYGYDTTNITEEFMCDLFSRNYIEIDKHFKQIYKSYSKSKTKIDKSMWVKL